MIIHKIHDLSNNRVIQLLMNGLLLVKGNDFENYSPLASNFNSNLFYILENGRYENGAYYIIEEDGKYIASAGWNMYDDNTALVLTRAFVSKEYRASYILGEKLLPLMISECYNVANIWITCNETNKTIYQWFSRVHSGKQGAIIKDWPDIYRRFEPIGKRVVYYTEQYVVQLRK